MHLNSAICLALMFSVSAFGAIFGDGDAQNGVEDQRQLAPRKILQSVGTIYCDGALQMTARPNRGFWPVTGLLSSLGGVR